MKKILIPILIALGVSGCDAGKLDITDLNQDQKDQLGQIASDYLIQHPEFLIKASEKLNQQKKAEMAQHSTETAKAMVKQLTQDEKTPFIGPKDAKVSVIEFFDYQCVFCAKITPIVNQLIQDNSDVKFVFKETPIFAQRWESSLYAAKMGQWIFEQKGSEAYASYHDNLFATGKNEGKLTKEDIDKQAQSAGVQVADFKMSELKADGINENFQLFSELGFQGTPALIVMPTSNPSIENIKIIGGFDPEGLKAAIAAIKKNIS
ncbi:DsbA family protein [Shewanella violacea]|uniref:DSBA-like thioredoxin domain protein n=1 Tax=Shewanella violacea (strain JCM 10179 / CIP 106290 / LMG 19151 / DSS12) TaxID=637905 RepID=D4ZEX2_SHEVD|nr:thioredoxin domain-containing protein [Shewanella violacea]BAJ00352.1 DSBA-like thioredoxin domain protein [Shewanella violacea DSS12]